MIKKKTFVPTLPKIFRSVTQNTLIFLFGLPVNNNIILKRFESWTVFPANIMAFLQ